jgi:hypothetical protein
MPVRWKKVADEVLHRLRRRRQPLALLEGQAYPEIVVAEDHSAKEGVNI